jgi:hypothetical protein
MLPFEMPRLAGFGLPEVFAASMYMSRQNTFFPRRRPFMALVAPDSGKVVKCRSPFPTSPKLGYYLQNNVLVYRKYIVG